MIQFECHYLNKVIKYKVNCNWICYLWYQFKSRAEDQTVIESKAWTIPVIVVQRFNNTSAVAWEERRKNTCLNTTNSCTDGCIAVGLSSWSQTKTALTVWNENMESHQPSSHSLAEWTRGCVCVCYSHSHTDASRLCVCVLQPQSHRCFTVVSVCVCVTPGSRVPFREEKNKNKKKTQVLRLEVVPKVSYLLLRHGQVGGSHAGRVLQRETSRAQDYTQHHLTSTTYSVTPGSLACQTVGASHSLGGQGTESEGTWETPSVLS